MFESKITNLGLGVYNRINLTKLNVRKLLICIFQVLSIVLFVQISKFP